MRILITGASGFIGSHLVEAMLEAGHEVVACVRQPEHIRQRWQNIAIIPADFCNDHADDDWLPRLEAVDVVINAVGIIGETRNQTFDALHTQAPIALFQACETVGVRRVIQISALGADDAAFSHYHISKRAADRFLRDRDLDWAVVMPSLVYGPGAKSMTMFKAISTLPLIPLIDVGDQCIQPIHIDDMTRAIRQLAETPEQLRTNVEMVGPKQVTMKTIYQKLRIWLGLGNASFISIPYRLALLGARWAGLLGQTPINAEAVQMLRNGNTGDVGPFIDRFGFRPQTIEQALAASPALQADRWHAGLSLLAPLLRITIAFLWIFTGIVSAFVFPVEQSYTLLARLGITGIWQPLLLYGAATADVLLGLATLFSFHLRLTVLIQIGIILLYSALITLWLPEYWAHPFGPISKNLPLVVATLIMLTLERR